MSQVRVLPGAPELAPVAVEYYSIRSASRLLKETACVRGTSTFLGYPLDSAVAFDTSWVGPMGYRPGRADWPVFGQRSGFLAR